MVEVQNVVGTGSLHVEVDVEQVASDLSLPEVRYDPETYHGVYLRLEEDAPQIVIYRTGKYNITGADSVDEAHEVNQHFLEAMVDFGLINDCGDHEFSVNNIVCTGDVGKRLDLEIVSIHLGLDTTQYEPETFPAMTYRPEDGECVFLVFSSGKVVITGSKTVEIAEEAFGELLDLLNNLPD